MFRHPLEQPKCWKRRLDDPPQLLQRLVSLAEADLAITTTRTLKQYVNNVVIMINQVVNAFPDEIEGFVVDQASENALLNPRTIGTKNRRKLRPVLIVTHVISDHYVHGVTVSARKRECRRANRNGRHWKLATPEPVSLAGSSCVFHSGCG